MKSPRCAPELSALRPHTLHHAFRAEPLLLLQQATWAVLQAAPALPSALPIPAHTW